MQQFFTLAAVLAMLGTVGCQPGEQVTEQPPQPPQPPTEQPGEAPRVTPSGGPVPVVIETTMGTIEIEVYPDRAPQTVENFLTYVRDGHYDGTIFHRVIPGFMIQGGGMTADMQEKSTRAPVRNESDNTLLNERGTVAMARTRDPHSATSQFFINVDDNAFLNYGDHHPQNWGYTVFGRVTEGMRVADRIVAVPTTVRMRQENVPEEPVIIERMSVREGAPAAAPEVAPEEAPGEAPADD
jgi:peptidyl-prolyl cis-trans isomerase B (cyclophilin B)